MDTFGCILYPYVIGILYLDIFLWFVLFFFNMFFYWHWDIIHIFTINLCFWHSYFKIVPFWFMFFQPGFFSLLFFMAMYFSRLCMSNFFGFRHAKFGIILRHLVLYKYWVVITQMVLSQSMGLEANLQYCSFTYLSACLRILLYYFNPSWMEKYMLPSGNSKLPHLKCATPWRHVAMVTHFHGNP